MDLVPQTNIARQGSSKAERINVEEYLAAYHLASADGWAADQIEFYENARPPQTAEEFAGEACWVVLNSGFRNTVARRIWTRLWPAIQREEPETVFGNAKKNRAMLVLWRDRAALHAICCQKLSEGVEPFVAWCRSLDGFGAIIPFHLAKNFGLPTAKADIWLERLAISCGESPMALCSRLAVETGHKPGTIDFVWWYVLSRGLLELMPSRRYRAGSILKADID